MQMPLPAPARPRSTTGARVAAGVLACAVAAACTATPPPPPTGSPTSAASSASPSSAAATTSAVTGPTPPSRASAADPTRELAADLSVPWSVVLLPAGGFLVSERDTARVIQVRPDGTRSDLGRVPGVAPGGEGGLLGLALHPRDPSVLYAYTTTASDNRVVTLALTGSGLGAPRPVLTGIPKGSIHNGGRLAFGPDGHLYVGTGDAGNRSASQDRSSLGGKILRVTADGAPAPGNPDASPVWSDGHRNVQGFAWDSAGRMWASEFGQNTWDELNQITPGSNYGWPLAEGRAERAGLVDPVAQWTPAESSPSGLAVGPDGAVYLAGLRGQSLWRVPVGADGQAGAAQRLLQGRYGRLRDVLPGPDGRIWVVSNNTSRGTARPGDDRVVSVSPSDLAG